MHHPGTRPGSTAQRIQDNHSILRLDESPRLECKCTMPEGGGKASKRSGGLELLRQVYEELYNHLREEFSPAEILRAAQTLIDVTDQEYSDKRYQDGSLHPGYYSFAVDRMILHREWWVLLTELSSDNLTDERLSENHNAKMKLKRFYNPDPYYHRG